MKFDMQKERRPLKSVIFSIAILFTHNLLAEEGKSASSLAPIRVDAEMISGLGLELASWPDKRKVVKRANAFEGKELTVSLYESSPKADGPVSTTVRTRDFPFDEFVYVLSGKAVLTDETGYAQAFVAGDAFVMQKGFSGTWEEVGVYREMVVIMTESRAERMPEVTPID